MELTLLPKHSPAMRAEDFLCLASRAAEVDGQLRVIWGDKLPGRKIFGTPSGRHALWYFLEAAGIPHEGDVIIAAYNYYVVVRLLVQWGLRPVFVDIDPTTLTLNPDGVASKLTARTRLVVVTHMFGCPANMDAILPVCTQNGVPVFEDCAHAVGCLDAHGQLGRRSAGALFSFGPQKILNCFGGGMLAMDPALAGHWLPGASPKTPFMVEASTAAKIVFSIGLSPSVYRWTMFPLIVIAKRLARRGWPWLRDLASPSKDLAGYRFPLASRPCFRSFMPALCARQLRRLENNIKARRGIISQIKAGTAHLGAYRFLAEDRFGRSNGSYFGVYVDDPEAFARFMLTRGIEVDPHEFYDCASLLQFAEFTTDCPHARWASTHLIRLPSYPQLSGRRVQRIVRAMTDYAHHSDSPAIEPQLS
jgi:dTDP-4-amino-4,6-dideoxygalactose transaminase